MIDTTRSMMYHIGNLNSESQRISYQTSTGKLLEKGSDDAMVHATLINLEDKYRVSESLNLQITKTRAINDTADTALKDMKESLDYIKIDLMKALNDGMDRTDKLALATNLRGIRDNMIDTLNTNVDGEYVFSGSYPERKTLTEDPDFKLNGKVSYDGDGFLRKIAVQPGSYRDRGVTAYDANFYTASSATPGNNLTFNDGERIIDENGHEWVLTDAPGVRYDKNDGGLTSPNFLHKLDHNGNFVDETEFPEAQIAVIATTPEVEATATAQAVRETYTINVDAAVQPEGRVFEAKHNYFDDLNIAINALEGHITLLDGKKGIQIDNTMVDKVIVNSLDQTSTQYNATNVGHGELGGRNTVFNVAQEKISAQLTHYNILIQETGGADLTKLAMESKALEITYQSLFSTIAKMNQLSLVNFIK